MLKKFGFTYLLMAFFMALSLLAGCGGGGGGGGIVADPIVETQLGDMRCVDEGTMIACRGIPYAEPPVGDLRFAQPVAHAGWTGTLDAREFGSACIQYADHDGNPLTPDILVGDEDCLSLNVFFPEDAEPGDNLPVMVWIHGGALIQGASSVPGYDVPALVDEGVIVVTINYRLNAFGFLPHPALEDPTGNFGLKDQVEALEWVQANIGDFGGDAGNVTIFGESAGGHSVLSLLVADPTEVSGLFHKAIVQSGSYSPSQMPLMPSNPADPSTYSVSNGYFYLGHPFANVWTVPSSGPCGGTDDAGTIRACLRDLTVEEVMTTQIAAPAWAWFTPVYQTGTFLPQSIAAGLATAANVPIMIGTNLHEGTLFAGLFLGDYSYMPDETNYRNGVNDLINPTGADPVAAAIADAAATYYLGVAPGTTNIYRNAYSMIWTDATFTCNCLAHWGQLAGAGRTVFAYWFADEDAPINPTYAALAGLAGMLDFGNWAVGASHSFEIQYIFGHVQTHLDVTADQIALSNRMITYWTNFAKNDAPGDAGEGEWTSFVTSLPLGNVWRLHPGGDAAVTAGGDFNTAHHCTAFWAPPDPT